MKLITELTEDIKYIKENTGNGDKNYFIEGTFMQSGVKNKNGRVYPQGTLAKETNRYINEYVNKGRALGELNHQLILTVYHISSKNSMKMVILFTVKLKF